MNTEMYKKARLSILDSLASKRNWGNSHTHFNNMFSGAEKHLRGTKEFKKASADLIKEGKIILKKTTQENHVSLNPKFSKEIKEELLTQNKYIKSQKEKVYILK